MKNWDLGRKADGFRIAPSPAGGAMPEAYIMYRGQALDSAVGADVWKMAKIATNGKAGKGECLAELTIEIMETLCYNSYEKYPIVKWGMIEKIKF